VLLGLLGAAFAAGFAMRDAFDEYPIKLKCPLMQHSSEVSRIRLKQKVPQVTNTRPEPQRMGATKEISNSSFSLLPLGLAHVGQRDKLPLQQIKFPAHRGNCSHWQAVESLQSAHPPKSKGLLEPSKPIQAIRKHHQAIDSNGWMEAIDRSESLISDLEWSCLTAVASWREGGNSVEIEEGAIFAEQACHVAAIQAQDFTRTAPL
jgi:hypothetical protein